MRMKGGLLVLFALLVVTLSASAGAVEQPVGEIRLSTLKGGEDIGPDYVRDVLVMLAKKARAEQGGQVADWLALYRQASEIPGQTAAQIAAKALLRAAHIAQTQGTPLEQSWARMQGKPAKVSDWLVLHEQASEIPGSAARRIAVNARKSAIQVALLPSTPLEEKWKAWQLAVPGYTEEGLRLLEQIIFHPDTDVRGISSTLFWVSQFYSKTELERTEERTGQWTFRALDPVLAERATRLVKRASARMIEVAETKNTSESWVELYENFPSGLVPPPGGNEFYRTALKKAVRTAATYADACGVVRSPFLGNIETGPVRQEARELMRKIGSRAQRMEAEREFPDCEL